MREDPRERERSECKRAGRELEAMENERILVVESKAKLAGRERLGLFRPHSHFNERVSARSIVEGPTETSKTFFLLIFLFIFFRSYYYSPVLLYLFLFSFSTGNARPPKDYKACLAIKTCCLNPFHGRARIHQGKKQKDFVLETISLGKLFRSLSYLLTLNFPDVYLFSYLIFTFSRLLDS